MNRLVTSKLTRQSTASSSMLPTLSTNAEEFFTDCGAFPARGVRMVDLHLCSIELNLMCVREYY